MSQVVGLLNFTSCLPMVGGSVRVLQLLPPLKLVAMILLKVALRHQIKFQTCVFFHRPLRLSQPKNKFSIFYYFQQVFCIKVKKVFFQIKQNFFFQSYTLRNGVLGVMGEILLKVLSKDDLDNKMKSTREQFLECLTVSIDH